MFFVSLLLAATSKEQHEQPEGGNTYTAQKLTKDQPTCGRYIVLYTENRFNGPGNYTIDNNCGCYSKPREHTDLGLNTQHTSRKCFGDKYND